MSESLKAMDALGVHSLPSLTSAVYNAELVLTGVLRQELDFTQYPVPFPFCCMGTLACITEHTPEDLHAVASTAHVHVCVI